MFNKVTLTYTQTPVLHSIHSIKGMRFILRVRKIILIFTLYGILAASVIKLMKTVKQNSIQMFRIDVATALI